MCYSVGRCSENNNYSICDEHDEITYVFFITDIIGCRLNLLIMLRNNIVTKQNVIFDR